MPQRTRKEKMAAQMRRQQHYRIIESSPVSEKKTGTKIDTSSPPIKTTPYRYIESEEDSLIKKYFLGDLRKSLILILLIFALEFFLYFARIGNYFGKIF